VLDNSDLEAKLNIDTKAETPRLYLAMATQLSSQIKSGSHKPGTRLPSERALMKQFDVSRSVVREALIVLQLEGLVEIRHGAGTFVTEGAEVVAGSISGFDFERVGPFELIQARIVVESETASLAAMSASKEELEKIAFAIRQMTEDQEPFMLRHGADKNFHTTIARASRNEAFAVVVEAMWERYDRLTIDNVSERARRPDNHQLAIDDHSRILHCIQNRDAAGARLAMRNHLERVSWFFSIFQPDGIQNGPFHRDLERR